MLHGFCLPTSVIFGMQEQRKSYLLKYSDSFSSSLFLDDRLSIAVERRT
ncbi:hypothetical protein HMPREF1553_00510 [Porphyromonas gingivalis F0568]|nr:hypothetical protein HMPREF1553_00510 [Porphyromonas gingivalis F0568]